MNDIITDTLDAVAAELRCARETHAPMNSAHEAYAIILEEVDELWEEIKKKRSERSRQRLREELLQVAAMACRAIIDLNLSPDNPARARSRAGLLHKECPIMAQPTFDPTEVINAATKVASAAAGLRDSIAAEHDAEDSLLAANNIAAGARADVEQAKGIVDDGIAATLKAEEALIALLAPATTGTQTTPPPGDAAAVDGAPVKDAA